MTTERDLIQRLTERLDHLHSNYDLPSQSALIAEALDYLDQPEPEGLTDEPLGDLIDKWVQEAFLKKPYGCKHPTHTYVACKAFEHGRNHAARTALAQPEPEGPTVMEIIALADEIEAEGLGQVDLVRRALTRWGSALPTPQP